DARPSGVNVHPDPLTGALDLHLRDPSALHPARQLPANLDVLRDVFRVLLVGVPARLPVRGDAESEAVRVDLLTHYRALPFWLFRDLVAAFGRDSISTVMWLVRLRIRYARPCARGRNRFNVGPSSTYAWCTHSVLGSRERLFSALAIALASTFDTGPLA